MNIKEGQCDTPWKSEAVYRERTGVCYVSEQGISYTHAAFLRLANGEERVANQLFDGCYWQEPEMLLIEELREAHLCLPRLSQHTKSNTWWLRFHVSPSEEQRSRLEAQGWREQTLVLWVTEREAAVVPEGIAFVREGRRDRTPQEEDAFRKELVSEDGLTQAARARHAAFKASVAADMRSAAQKVCYIIDQLPENAQAWADFEQVNGRGLRTLFLTQLAESEEELWRALDRLAPTCAFTITHLEKLKSLFQVKGNRRHGTITRIIAREASSPLVSVVERVRQRINQEPARNRLTRKWREQNEARAGRIEEETCYLEALPTLSELYPDLYPNLEEQQTSIFEVIMRLESVQQAYEEAIQHLAALSASVSADRVVALITTLEGEYQRCITQQQESTLHGGSSVVQGQAFAYQQLAQDAREWLPIL